MIFEAVVLLAVVAALVALDLAALKWGPDSRDAVDPRRPPAAWIR